jgi:hypothetical protein
VKAPGGTVKALRGWIHVERRGGRAE